MYILLSLYLPTHLILLRLSLPPPCLSTPPLLHFLFFLLRILSFCSLSLSSISNASLLYSLYSLSLSLYPPFSVTPPYSSPYSFPFTLLYSFPSFFFFLFSSSLIGSFPSLPSFSLHPIPPPLPLSFFIRPLLGLIRLLNALSPHRPLDGSHFPFRSPLFPPIIFFSPLSSLLFDIPILIFFPVIIATSPARPL